MSGPHQLLGTLPDIWYPLIEDGYHCNTADCLDVDAVVVIVQLAIGAEELL